MRPTLLAAAACTVLHLTGAPVARAQAPGANAAIRSLMDSANYWKAQGQPAAALRFIDRALAVAPRDPDTLAAAADMALLAGDSAASDRYRSRLAELSPSDPRAANSAARKGTPEELAKLASARASVQKGDFATAAKQYQALIAEKPMLGIDVEYYEALAHTTSEGFDQAANGLRAMIEREPRDLALRIAYARVLVLQEETRDEAIDELAELAAQPSVSATVRPIWRQALLWQGANERAQAQLGTYMRSNPSDPEVEAKAREFAAALPDPSTKALLRGIVAMNNKDSAGAEQSFRLSAKLDPTNANPLVMLAIVKRGQGRGAEAQALVSQAIGLAPERRAEFIASIGGLGGGGGNVMSAEMAAQMQVSALTMAGKLDQAEQKQQEIVARKPTAAGRVELGELQLRNGHLDAAGGSFRSASEGSPNADAICGLAKVELRRGRMGEAGSLFKQASALYAASHNVGGLRQVSIGQAEIVRASATGQDLASVTRIYSDALAADRASMPLRRDYARLLLQNGRAADAWNVLTAGVELNRNQSFAVRVALDVATQAGDKPHEAAWSELLKGSR